MKFWGAVSVLAALTVSGCRSPGHVLGRRAPAPVELPVVGRAPIEPDVAAIPATSVRPLQRPEQYRQLTAAECRHLAIRQAPFATDLDQHADNHPPAFRRIQKNATRQAEVSRLVRGYAADELRNRAAADALTEFYQLLQAEGQWDRLRSAHHELHTQIMAAEKAEATGFKDRADIPALRRRLLDLEAQLAQVQATIAALNASLRSRLGLLAHDPLPLWPSDPLRVKPDDVDADQAVLIGLHYRPDLNLLRVLADGTAGELTNAVLQSVSPLLASTKSSHPLTALLGPIFAPLLKEPHRQQAEANARVRSALLARERQAEAEIRAAAVLLRGHRATIAARAMDVQHIDRRIAELETRQQSGLNVSAELATARLERHQADSALLRAVIDWHTTEVKLRQAMGLLIRE
ncbi:MAG: hypothetical protein RMJ56_03710 [Gemmataceae bacterium]|nr:hypothetical protein [Gemmata sp.]MDW8196695.1 hypothetical protein [Gemmataceae bacterium]